MIQDYSSLQSEIANWLARTDLVNDIPTFIQLAESRINRELFVRQRQAQVSGTSSGGVIPVPSDFYRLQALQVPRGACNIPLNPVPPNAISTTTGPANAYAVVGDEFRLSGTEDTDYTLTYWTRVPALTDAEPQNWLLTQEPAIYLYGSLVETAPFLKDDPRLALWLSLFSEIVSRLEVNDEYQRYGNAPMMRSPISAP